MNSDSTFKLVPRWINKSMFLRIRRKNDDDDNSWNKWATFHAVKIYHLILCIRNYNETLSDIFETSKHGSLRSNF